MSRLVLVALVALLLSSFSTSDRPRQNGTVQTNATHVATADDEAAAGLFPRDMVTVSQTLSQWVKDCGGIRGLDWIAEGDRNFRIRLNQMWKPVDPDILSMVISAKPFSNVNVAVADQEWQEIGKQGLNSQWLLSALIDARPLKSQKRIELEAVRSHWYQNHLWVRWSDLGQDRSGGSQWKANPPAIVGKGYQTPASPAQAVYYIPKVLKDSYYVHGVRTVRPLHTGNQWQVFDDTGQKRGVNFRRTKDEDDFVNAGLDWGQIFYAVDEGGNWLRVQAVADPDMLERWYLWDGGWKPMELNPSTADDFEAAASQVTGSFKVVLQYEARQQLYEVRFNSKLNGLQRNIRTAVAREITRSKRKTNQPGKIRGSEGTAGKRRWD